MLSYHEQLKKIGEPQVGKAVPAFPRGFCTAPKSLRAAMIAMNSPHPETWFNANEGFFRNDKYPFTDEVQGVATDGESWYISSSNCCNEGKYLYRGIYRLDPSSYYIIGFLSMPCPTGNKDNGHVGAITCFDGWLYIPMEQPALIFRAKGADIVGNVDISILGRGWPLVGSDGGPPPQEPDLPWCAINPWNGLLYSSRYDGVTEIHAYHLTSLGGHSCFCHVPEATIRLQGGPVGRIQGGCFSKNGHLLLTSDDDPKGIRCYSCLNGVYYGFAGIDWEGHQEVEGLTIWENLPFEGVATHIHVILLENNLHEDDFYFKHYTVPQWQDL